MSQPPVSVTSYGAAGSSARVRVFDWFDHLGIVSERHDYLGTGDNRLGSLVTSLPRLVSAERDVTNLPERVAGRTVVLSRRASPFTSGRREERILRAAARGVYDVDDALYADDRGLARRFWSPPEVWRRSIGAADVVIAGNAILAERAAEHSRNVVVIPSCVDPDVYAQKTIYETGETPRAVWIGSPSTEQHLTHIADALLSLHRSRGLRVTVVSAGAADLGALNPMVDRREWHVTGFGAELAQADFGIMPLRDTAFTRGKCAYKLLQYAAAALPVIGSPVGTSATVLSELGGVAVADGEWADAMSGVLDAPPDRRRAAGTAARAAVIAGYSFDAWADVWRATALGSA